MLRSISLVLKVGQKGSQAGTPPGSLIQCPQSSGQRAKGKGHIQTTFPSSHTWTAPYVSAEDKLEWTSPVNRMSALCLLSIYLYKQEVEYIQTKEGGVVTEDTICKLQRMPEK